MWETYIEKDTEMRDSADAQSKHVAGPAQHFSGFGAMLSHHFLVGILSTESKQSQRLLLCHQG